MTKLKAFAEDNFSVAQMVHFFFDRQKNIVEKKRKNAGYQHFLLFTQCFFNPLPDDKILDWSKLKQSADDSFKFDVNSRKFSKLVENTVGKGEIARYEQFLLFPQCFQKACFPGVSKGVIVLEWVKSPFPGTL